MSHIWSNNLYALKSIAICHKICSQNHENMQEKKISNPDTLLVKYCTILFDDYYYKFINNV